jgi:hypothetical protein
LIKSYPVYRENHRDTKHLRAYETLWFNKSLCVNQYTPVEYLRKEKKKQYREKNKEVIVEKKKQYHENNKEAITQKQKQYRENNKEKIKEYREKNKEKIWTYKHEKIQCKLCNSFTVRGSMARHQRTNKCKTSQAILVL